MEKRSRLLLLGVISVTLSYTSVTAVGAAKRAATPSEKKYFCAGECEVQRQRCSCMSGCKANKTCCIDYEESCNGGQSWKDTECTPAEEMKCPNGYGSPPPLIILSIDGYRDIYYHRSYTPTITKLATCGVEVPYMRSAYPSKTFPNHYSIVTGLYPESHGIIANTIYNHDKEEEFRLGRESSFHPHWWHGEPIWVTASNQGLKSATYFWPGSEVNITRYPDYYYNYDESVDNEERVYQALKWLDMTPEEGRPSFIALYTHIVDTAGHNGGPFGSLVNKSLPEADKMVEMIMNGLRDRELDTCVNFIITSDHGMADVDCPTNVRFLENYGINMSEVYFDGGPYGRVGKSADKGLWEKFDAVETKEKLECMREETHWKAFLKYEYLPKRYHYANDPWIEPVHLVADDEWWIAGETEDKNCEPGQHGFDNLYVDMRAFFTAHGIGLKRGYRRSMPVENIEIYNLMADLLNLDAAPNNGTEGGLVDVMKDAPTIPKQGTGVEAQVCQYPTDDTQSNDLGCPTCTGENEAEANQMLDLNESDVSKYNSENMLYGTPKILRDDAEYCILTQRGYVTIYDKKLKMPIMSSFVLDAKSSDNVWEDIGCVRRDIRVDDASSTPCSEYDTTNQITQSFLYSPNLADEDEKTDATISSNTVPVYDAFAEIWDFMGKSFRNWAGLYNGIMVEVGPIFDYNYDGHADSSDFIESNGTFLTDGGTTPIPTHFFVIASRCREYGGSRSIRDCATSLDNIDQLNFIIPNYKEAPCHEDGDPMSNWLPSSLLIHVARIRDIELLSEISFLSTWMSKETEAGQASLLSAIRTKLLLPEFADSWMQDFINNVTPSAPPMQSTTSDAKSLHKVNGWHFAIFVTMSISNAIQYW